MFSFTFLISCSEEEEPPVTPTDTTKPVITILSPTDISRPLRATVSVKAEATDETGIAKVEVFVDGISIASATTSPIEASWDTKTVTDGTHQIKIVAEDAEGNKEEKSLNVDVKNMLFTFLIGPEYVPEDERGWIFVTDEAGALLDTQEMINGDKLSFATPEGYDPTDRFSFHRFQYSLQDLGVNTYALSFILSYTGLPSGNFIMNDGTPTARTPIGTHSIQVSNVPAGPPAGPPFSPSIVSFDGALSSSTGSSPDYTITVDLYKSPTAVILSDQKSSTLTQGIKIDMADVGGTTNIDYGDLTEFDFIGVDVGEHIGEGYSVTLVPIAGDYVNTVFFTFLTRDLSSPISDPIKVYRPDLNPVEFITSLRYVDLESVSRRYTVVSPTIPSQVKTIAADISSVTENNGTLQVDATGEFQYVSASSEIFEIDENGNFVQLSWFVYADKSSMGSIAKPQFSEALEELYPDIASLDPTFDFVSLFKNEGIDGYLDYVDKRYSGERIFKFSKEQFQISKSFAPPFGRTAPKKMDPYRGSDIPKSERYQ